MPRQYKCRKCGVVHAPPTGKHCRNQGIEEEVDELQDDLDEQQEVQNDETQTLAILLELKQQMNNFGEQMGLVGERLGSLEDTRDRFLVDSDIRGATGGMAEEEDALATPTSLRKDMRLMRQAANRLANLQLDDSDDELEDSIPRGRAAGKKSGALLTASNTIERRIDWPHFHVKRMAGVSKKGILFRELKVEELVYGFLCMIESPRGKWDRDEMIIMLKHMMQDTIEFSWANVLSFYETLGLEVEKKETQWADKDRIRELRMTYARTVFPAKRENKEAPRAQLMSAPVGMKCCIPFQKRACKNDRDHPPFTHACTYCFRTKAALCRHGEEECMRKTIDNTKNGGARGQ